MKENKKIQNAEGQASERSQVRGELERVAGCRNAAEVGFTPKKMDKEGEKGFIKFPWIGIVILFVQHFKRL